MLRPRGELGASGLWILLPGIFGFCLVVGLPLALAQLGAMRVFVVVVASQMAVSGVWDAWVEGIPPSPLRVLGAALALIGAVLVNLAAIAR
jgi:uncharacterized membrane protein YdcZ (DUF606 family)